MEDIKLEESLDFVDAVDFANSLRPYEEGLGDVAHKIGTGIKNFFGTKAGAAQRANADAQVAQQTAQTNQDTANIQAASADQAAQQIIDLLNNAFKKDLKTQAKNDKNAEKQKQQQAVEAQKNANAAQQSEPENNGTGDTNAE